MNDHIVTKLLREIREETAFRTDVDPPAYEAADRLWRRYHQLAINISPDDREKLEREIRKRTGT